MGNATHPAFHRPTVYVVDEDDDDRASTLLLVRQLGFHGRGFPSGEALVATVDQLATGCAVTELVVGQMTVSELVQALRAKGRADPVIVASAFATVPGVVDAFRCGVADVLEKPLAAEPLEVILKHSFGVLEEKRARSSAALRLSLLAPRELAVAYGIADGHSSKTIARYLGISPRTVEAYRANIHSKTECHGVAEVVSMVMASRLAHQDDRPLS